MSEQVASFAAGWEPSDPATAEVLPRPRLVDLWLADVDATAAARMREYLLASELERADRFRFDADRHAFVTCRGLVRMILGRIVEADPIRLPLKATHHGKLFVERCPVRFNVAHSGTLGVIAVAAEEVGVDIEKHNDRLGRADLARRFFSPTECASLSQLDPMDFDAGFYRCWTRKEAYIKGRGLGLSLPLDSFDVPVEAADDKDELSVAGDEGEAANWALRSLEVAHGYAAAVALRSRGWSLQKRRVSARTGG